jgi:hypothetical protein
MSGGAAGRIRGRARIPVNAACGVGGPGKPSRLKGRPRTDHRQVRSDLLGGGRDHRPREDGQVELCAKRWSP